MGRFLKWLGYAFLALFATVFAIWVTPLLKSSEEQDDCIFGSVSNAEYRTLLNEINEQKRTGQLDFQLPKSGGDDANVEYSKLLQGIVDQHVREQSTLDAKVAVLHALMRSVGALYRNTSIGSNFVSNPPDQSTDYVMYAYHIDVNRHGHFALWRRWVRVAVVLEQAEYVEAADRFSFKVFVLLRNPFDPSYAFHKRSPYGENCPIVPEWDVAP